MDVQRPVGRVGDGPSKAPTLELDMAEPCLLGDRQFGYYGYFCSLAVSWRCCAEAPLFVRCHPEAAHPSHRRPFLLHKQFNTALAPLIHQCHSALIVSERSLSAGVPQDQLLQKRAKVTRAVLATRPRTRHGAVQVVIGLGDGPNRPGSP